MIENITVKKLLKKLVSYNSFVYIRSKNTWKLRPYLFVCVIIKTHKHFIDDIIFKCVPITRNINKLDENFININLSDVVCFSNKTSFNNLFTK